MQEILDHFEEKKRIPSRIILYAFLSILILGIINSVALLAHFEYLELYPVFEHITGQLATGLFFLIAMIFTIIILPIRWMVAAPLSILGTLLCFTLAFQLVFTFEGGRHFIFMTIISILHCTFYVLLLELIYRFVTKRKKLNN